ncbi:NAD(P)/FAD-dependent oxidoreductase [Eionea flava]
MNIQSSPVIAIIGAGPAGLSAALWLNNLGLTPIILEQGVATGGMLNVNFLSNDWVLGQTDVTGPEMAARYDQHISEKAIDLRVQTQLHSMTRDTSGNFCLTLRSSKTADDNALSTLECAGVLIATGTRYVDKHIFPDTILDIAAPYIIEGPYAFVDIEQQKSKTVVVVGAGDNAFENASMLLEQGCRVIVVARSTPRAQRKFMDKVAGHEKATIIEHATLASTSRLNGQLNVQLSVRSEKSDRCSFVEITAVDTIHLLAGYRPNSESLIACIAEGLGENLSCDEQYFLQVDQCGRTNIAGIYAAGDICNTGFPSVVSAVSGGALAAKIMSQDISSASTSR